MKKREKTLAKLFVLEDFLSGGSEIFAEFLEIVKSFRGDPGV